MKSNASTFKTRQHVAGWSSGKSLTRSVASLLAPQVLSQIAVFNGCFAVVREMELRTDHSSVWVKQRAVIEFFTAEGVSSIEIHRRMQVVYSDDCVDISTVHHWTNRCKDGKPEKSDLCDKQRIGWPVTATNEFHKKQVDEMIKENRRIT
jgi:hypothetical protein